MDETMFLDDKKIAGIVNYKRALIFMAFSHKGRLTANVKSFTGLANIGFLRVKARQRYQLTAVTDAGKMKLVAVSRQKAITVLSETGAESGKIIYLEPGYYRIRAIGLNASFHFELISENHQANLG